MKRTGHTLVMILSYARARDQVWRHAEWYRRSGCDLLGVNTIGGEHDWPEGFKTTAIGFENEYIQPGRGGTWEQEAWICTRFLDCIEFFIENYDHAHLLITEPDSIFLGPVPRVSMSCFATYAGECPKEWDVPAKKFYHPPWWMNRKTCLAFVEAGDRVLFDNQDNGHGAVDVFFGSVVEELGIQPASGGTWSCNGGDLKWRRKFLESRNAVRSGIWFVHGIDTAEELKAVTEVRP